MNDTLCDTDTGETGNYHAIASEIYAEVVLDQLYMVDRFEVPIIAECAIFTYADTHNKEWTDEELDRISEALQQNIEQGVAEL